MTKLGYSDLTLLAIALVLILATVGVIWAVKGNLTAVYGILSFVGLAVASVVVFIMVRTPKTPAGLTGSEESTVDTLHSLCGKWHGLDPAPLNMTTGLTPPRAMGASEDNLLHFKSEMRPPSERPNPYPEFDFKKHTTNPGELEAFRDLETAARAALDAAWGYASSICQEFCVHRVDASSACPTKDPSLKALEAALAALDKAKGATT